MEKPNSFTFFYPSKIVGGAEFLFIRLAKYLSSEFKIYYIDYDDGFARLELDGFENPINFISFNRRTRIPLEEDTSVITPLSSIADLMSFVDCRINCKVLFWSIHPYGLKNVIQTFRDKHILNLFLKDKREVGKAVEFLILKKSLLFMDGPNLWIQERYFEFIENEPLFLPIPCDEQIVVSDRVKKPSSQINVSWLGRLSEDKIYSLLNILSHADHYVRKNKKNINFSVIGDGDKIDFIKNKDFDERLSIKIYRNLKGEELDRFLLNNTHLMFAMGTSALEGASRQIPTVLVDFSYKAMPITNKFRWIFENTMYSLGDEHSDINNYQNTFEDIVNQVLVNYDDIQVKCHAYFKKNHSMASVAEKLLNLEKASQLRLSDLNKTQFNFFSTIGFLRRIRNSFKL